MPELKTYTASGQVRSGPIADPPSVLDAPARALEGLGATMIGVGQDVSRIVEQRKKEDDLRWATETESAFNRALMERQVADSQNPKETEGPEFRDFADATLNNFAKSAPSKRAADIFRSRAIDTADRGYNRALQSGEQTRLVNADNSNTKAVSDAVEAFRLTSQAYPAQVNEIAIPELDRFTKFQLAGIQERFGKTMPAMAQKMTMRVVEEVAYATAATNADYARSFVAKAPISEEAKLAITNRIESIERNANETTAYNLLTSINNAVEVSLEQNKPVAMPSEAALKVLTPYQQGEVKKKVEIANGTFKEYSKIQAWNWVEQDKAIKAIDIGAGPVEKGIRDQLVLKTHKAREEQTKDPAGWQRSKDPEFQNVPANETVDARMARLGRMVALQGPYPNNYGYRADGTPKGPGFLGPLKRSDGSVSTELSIGVELDGKEVEIPSLVPTLTQSEIDHLLSGEKPTDAIVEKAVAHARKRMDEGQSPFMEDEQAKRYLNLPTGMQKVLSTADAEARAATLNNIPPNQLTQAVKEFQSQFPDTTLAAMAWNDLQNLPEGKRLQMGIRVAGAIEDDAVKNNFLGAMGPTEAPKTKDSANDFAKELSGRVEFTNFKSGWIGDGNQRSDQLKEFEKSIIRYAMDIASRKGLSASDGMDIAIQRVITDNYGFMRINGTEVPVYRFTKAGRYSDADIALIARGIEQTLANIPVKAVSTDLYHFPLQPRLPGDQTEANRYLAKLLRSTSTVVVEPDGASATVYVKGENVNDFPFQLRGPDGLPFVFDFENMSVRGDALRREEDIMSGLDPRTGRVNPHALRDQQIIQEQRRKESERRVRELYEKK